MQNKTSFDELNRLTKRICELENSSDDITQSETQRDKDMKKKCLKVETLRVA